MGSPIAVNATPIERAKLALTAENDFEGPPIADISRGAVTQKKESDYLHTPTEP